MWRDLLTRSRMVARRIHSRPISPARHAGSRAILSYALHYKDAYVEHGISLLSAISDSKRDYVSPTTVAATRICPLPRILTRFPQIPWDLLRQARTLPTRYGIRSSTWRTALAATIGL